MLNENTEFNQKEKTEQKIKFLRREKFTKEHSKHPFKKKIRWGGN